MTPLLLFRILFLTAATAINPNTCPTCGTEFSGAMKFCPVCVLRQALVGKSDFDEPAPVSRRLEHYELVTGEDGKPIELGRGAMGVTYKAR
jgi:hypothetical protein